MIADGWQTIRDNLERSGRSRPYVDAGCWALETLEMHLGGDWVQRAREQNDELPLGLHFLGSHPLALAQALEWALALCELREVPGFADLRDDLRDASSGRISHTELQLATAAHGLRLGQPVRLEPLLPGATRPADLAFGEPELVVEARVLTESARRRHQRMRIDELMDRVRDAAWSQHVSVSGTISRMPAEGELAAVEGWICDRAPLVAAGAEPASLELPGLALRLSAGNDPAGRLVSPRLEEELLPRMARTIGDKAAAMRGSRAAWLRITLLTGVWMFTPWGLASLEQKLETLRDALETTLGQDAPPGIVVSSAAGLYNGPVPEETVRIDRVTAAVRRAVLPQRARETLIIAFDGSEDAVEQWLHLADAERDWLPWALAQRGMPDPLASG